MIVENINRYVVILCQDEHSFKMTLTKNSTLTYLFEACEGKHSIVAKYGRFKKIHFE